MRKLILALGVLLLSVSAALWFQRQGGFVLIALGEWTVQVSVLVFVLGLVLLLVLAHYGIALLRSLAGMPQRMRGWRARQRHNRARNRLSEALIRLAEGHPQEAEKLLLKDIDRADTPLLHYLAAAVAAQQRGSYDERDRHLASADRTSRKARRAVALLQAQLQIEARQWEQALASLTYLFERSPRDRRVLHLLVKACLALNEWDRLEAILPVLRKQEVQSEEQLRELEKTVAVHRLALARGDASPAIALERVWNRLPRGLRDDPELLLPYVDGLAGLGQVDEAERVLRTALQKQWRPELVQRYGALETEAPEQALAQLEKWLKERPEDPALLYAAGYQALRARLWGRGRSYLEAATGRGTGPEPHFLLGAVLERMDEPDAALEQYRQALALQPGQPALPDLSGAGRSRAEEPSLALNEPPRD